MELIRTSENYYSTFWNFTENTWSTQEYLSKQIC